LGREIADQTGAALHARATNVTGRAIRFAREIVGAVALCTRDLGIVDSFTSLTQLRGAGALAGGGAEALALIDHRARRCIGLLGLASLYGRIAEQPRVTVPATVARLIELSGRKVTFGIRSAVVAPLTWADLASGVQRLTSVVGKIAVQIALAIVDHATLVDGAARRLHARVLGPVVLVREEALQPGRTRARVIAMRVTAKALAVLVTGTAFGDRTNADEARSVIGEVDYLLARRTFDAFVFTLARARLARGESRPANPPRGSEIAAQS
jgi:hypothetical protein